MRALAKLRPEPGIWMTQADIPPCGADDVLIGVKRTAICGTDIHIYNWDAWAAATIPIPMITGHEFGGEIVEVGTAVTRDLKIGQRVSAEGHIVDLDGAAARAGQFHLDPHARGLGVHRQGAFADFVALPAFNVVPLPRDVSLEHAALLDPLGNAVHTAEQFDLLGQNVLVTGAGPIGIMAAAVARRAGARAVIITDVNPYRLGLAADLADVRPVDLSAQTLEDVMAEVGVGDGFDVAMEMSGAPSAITQAVGALKMGGGLAMLGIPSGTMEVAWSEIILKSLTIKGVYGRRMFETWRKMLGLLEAGLDLDRLITHRLPAGEFQAGFEAMRSGQSGKVVLDWCS
jgi:threonine 3-dehydrogenase